LLLDFLLILNSKENMAKVQQLTNPLEGVTCHAWNANKTSKFAIIPLS
jgi:hypothetical protein